MLSNEHFTNFLRLGIFCHQDDILDSQTKTNASFNAISSAFHPAGLTHLLPDDYSYASSPTTTSDDDYEDDTSSSSSSYSSSSTSDPNVTSSSGQGNTKDAQDTTASKESIYESDKSSSIEHDLSLEDLAYIVLKEAYDRKTFQDTNPNVSVRFILSSLLIQAEWLTFIFINFHPNFRFDFDFF